MPVNTSFEGRVLEPAGTFVVGRENSPGGVRLNTGGRARVDIVTSDARRYGVVVDTMEQARQIVDALRIAH